jgi:metal-dependent amidase/aminoacylase/carboxypeptidase family protein
MVLRRLEEIVNGTSVMMGAKATIEWMPNTPAVVNDKHITAVVQEAVVDLFGPQALETEERTMGSEDASFFLQVVPGSYLFIGSGSLDGDSAPHHNSHFDINEQALVNGVAVMIESLRRLMTLKNLK